MLLNGTLKNSKLYVMWVFYHNKNIYNIPIRKYNISAMAKESTCKRNKGGKKKAKHNCMSLRLQAFLPQLFSGIIK